MSLASPADVLIMGGAAGGMKTFTLLMEPVRHKNNRGFRAILFRRTRPMLKREGGAWDESFQMFPGLGAKPSVQEMRWIFREGAHYRMDGLEYESTIYGHHSAQYTLIEFDELVEFTERQFWYMFSRNRSLCGVKPYIRAGTNPDPDSFVRKLIDWYIGGDGLPILKRSGILRYFARDGNKVIWVDKHWRSPEGDPPKSFTFIPSKLEDNKILMQKDPGYRQNLNSLDRVSRARLLGGNWDIREEDGMFETDWFGICSHLPVGIKMIRYWDRAATEQKDKNDPDWTAGVKLGVLNGTLYIADIRRFRGSPGVNERKIKKAAEVDSKKIPIIIEEEGGSAGKDSTYHYRSNVLAGYIVYSDRPVGSKIERCKPWCAWAEFGHVKLLRGAWIHDFLDEVERYPGGKMDQVDAVSGGFNWLTAGKGLSTRFTNTRAIGV